jgi:hypothetical protein
MRCSRLASGAVFIALICAVSIRVALKTRVNSPPDERVHVDAFRYYETHWWIPSVNDDLISYSNYG